MRASGLRYSIAAAVAALRRHVPALDPFSRRSWSQEGEDLLLSRLLERRESGFYVDVGAHDPFRFSNSAYFYARGWRGLNIEPDPAGADLIRRYRPRDIVVNLGVGIEPSMLTFFRFNEPALNTFDADLARERLKDAAYRIVEEKKIEVDRLDRIFAMHLPAGQTIDFMSVDAEGADLAVLKSNDWGRFRPAYVVAETLNLELAAMSSNETVAFMCDAGYRPVAAAFSSVFFADGRT